MLQHQVKLEPTLPVNGPKPRGRRKKVRTEPIRPICPQCEKQFSNQSALTKHKLTHSDERKFACQQCSKAFKRHDHLTGHMQTHSNRKPFNCTLPGCDKTYCDARSLRRHKENIHHIVTPRENNSTNNNNNNNNHHNTYDHINTSNNNIHQIDKINQNCTKSNGYIIDNNNNNISTIDMNNNSISSTTTNANGAHIISHHQTSHDDMNLSPTTTYQTSTMSSTATSTDNLIEGQTVYMTHSTDAQQQPQQQQPSLPPPTQNQHLQPSHLLRRRIQRLHSDQGPYSCNTDGQDLLSGRGYLACSTTTNPHNIPTQPHQHNGNNHHHHDHYLNNQHASYSADYATSQHFNFDFNNNLNTHHMDHAISSSTIPLSADSVTDSGLGLNVHYERRTPNHQQQHQQPQQQPQHQQQPSYQRYPHSQNDTCYSAGYAATQHFDFDNQHASFSADYASTQQFNFDFSNMNNHHMDHAISSSTMPLSADSVTDSGLALNVHYERQTPNHQQQQQQQPQPQPQPQTQPQPPPPLQTQPQQPQHQEQPLYQRYQHTHQVSYSAGYASTQHFDFV